MENRELLKKQEEEEEKKAKEDDEKLKASCLYKFQVSCAGFVDHNVIQVLMTIVTIYALLGDDLKLLTTTIEADVYFTAATAISLVLFMLELILASIGKEDYFNSFFFWLDLVSTLSLVTDIPPIMDAIVGGEVSNDSLDAELDNLDNPNIKESGGNE